MTEDNIVKEQEALCRANPLVLNSLVYCYYQCNPHGNFCNVKQSIFLNWYLLIHVKLWSCHWKLRLCLVVSCSRGPRSIFPKWDQCWSEAVQEQLLANDTGDFLFHCEAEKSLVISCISYCIFRTLPLKSSIPAWSCHGQLVHSDCIL